MSTLTRTRACGPAATLAALLVPAAPAWADLDAAALRLWGGNWSVACGNTAAPYLRVLQSSLMVVARNRQLAGRQVRPAYSYFGQSTPENFDVALLSEVRPGAELTFLIWRDARGPYIEISGDKAVETALAPVLGSAMRAKYRDCNAAARPPSGDTAAPAPPPLPAPGEAASPTDLLRDPRFKAAYLAALGPLAREAWLRTLNGPAPPNRQVQIDGHTYTLSAACKPHDCGDNNLVLLYNPRSGTVHGRVLQQGRRATLIGKPPPRLAAAIETLWRQEWRQGR
ncbi:Ivy family c-type lysozyme inhibitor [Thiomonas intermedia]|uniref:Ivy family c-type lysozyme inhibitor n=1 Tax=Thiomonas intermedia TaxID=926 RepID=UPI0009A4942C|nr:Ivy family c-type lysozyme inhibitor [Thiomonas intermedia]